MKRDYKKVEVVKRKRCNFAYGPLFSEQELVVFPQETSSHFKDISAYQLVDNTQ